MPAYYIADVDVHDPEPYAEYRAGVPASLEPYGGRFVVRGGGFEVKEGDWTPTRLVMLKFATMERARAWYDSEEYAPLLALRKRTATSRVMIVEGLDAD